jgi:hypothetical protein
VVAAEADRRFYEFDRTRDKLDSVIDTDNFNELSIAMRTNYSWSVVVNELHTLTRHVISHVVMVEREGRYDDTRYRDWLRSLSENCTLYTNHLRNFAEATRD